MNHVGDTKAGGQRVKLVFVVTLSAEDRAADDGEAHIGSPGRNLRSRLEEQVLALPILKPSDDAHYRSITPAEGSPNLGRFGRNCWRAELHPVVDCGHCSSG